MSTKVFTQDELSVLDKGLKFAPPKRLDKFGTFIDIQKYIRKINIQRYLITNPIRNEPRAATSGTVHSGLRNPSLFNPSVPAAAAVNIFKDLVLKDLAEIPDRRNSHHPVSSVGFKSLCQNKDIIIRPADKGGGIVILDKPDYETEML